MKNKFYLTKKLLSKFIDMVFPHYCAICQDQLSEDEVGICATCASQLHIYYEDIHHGEERLYGSPLFRRLYALYNYHMGNGVRRMILSFKYNGYVDIAKFVGQKAKDSFDINPHTIDFIVPIPAEPKREEKRGYNQALLVANSISNLTNIPVIENFIQRKKGSHTQTTLDRNTRKINTLQAFYINPDSNITLKGKNILVVDDILTTGSTLLAVFDLLESVKVSRLDVFVIAVAS